MSPWLFNVYMDGVMVVNMGMGRGSEIAGGWKIADDLALCSKSEEDLRVMV